MAGSLLADGFGVKLEEMIRDENLLTTSGPKASGVTSLFPRPMTIPSASSECRISKAMDHLGDSFFEANNAS